MAGSATQALDYLTERLSDRDWRLDNLYYIRNAKGERVLFKRNWAQKNFFENIWYFNTILKARQLGFSTFILIYMLDACLFNDNHSAGVIAQSLVDASDLFENKVKYAYDNLPDEIKLMIPAEQDSSRKLSFANGSSITVGTSLRGGTYQKLHISEYGKISAKYPDKAQEIKTGAFNTVHAGQQIFVESTAEGQGGEFYDLCERAKRLDEQGDELTVLDPKFHFYPWFKNPEYCLTEEDARKVAFTAEAKKYFSELEAKGVSLNKGQRAWYIKKAEQQGDDMKREFPSTPEEAFETAVEGAYYSTQLALIRRKGQVTSVPYDPAFPVNTFWDIGISDMVTIWFMQYIAQEYRFVNYFEDHNEGIEYYADILKDLHRMRGYRYDTHYMPHDGNARSLQTGKTLEETARNHGIDPIIIVPRTSDLKNDIQKCRNILPMCWFDKENCAQGLSHLGNYRKEWDDKLSVWRDRPRHDSASHGADGFRTFAVGYEPPTTVRRRKREAQTVWDC